MTAQMCETPIKGVQGFLNWFIEYFLFYRWIYFKNRPRVNFLLLRSLMIVGTWFGLYYAFFSSFELLVIGVDLDPVILLGIFVAIGFFAMSNAFAKKSVDCLHLYNEYLRAFAQGEYNVAKMLATSLALQLIMVDLYAHRNFSWLFSKVMLEALGHNELALENFKAGKMPICEARSLLQQFLQSQMDKLGEGKSLV